MDRQQLIDRTIDDDNAHYILATLKTEDGGLVVEAQSGSAMTYDHYGIMIASIIRYASKHRLKCDCEACALALRAMVDFTAALTKRGAN